MALNLRVISRKDLFEDLSTEGIITALRDVLDTNSSIYLIDDEYEVIADGEAEPQKVVEIAKKWNQEILARAVRETATWLKVKNLDSTESFNARKAMTAADNIFSPGAKNAVVVYGTCADYLAPLLPEGMLKEIIEKPEEYVVLDVVYDY